MSVDASGTYGKALVFSKWKGRNYVRERVTPTNPKAPKQCGVRSMMGFLANQWYGLSVPNKATWDDAALARQISSFNQYASHNLDRWQTFAAPTKAFPAAEASTGLTVTTQTLTGDIGFATIQITPSGATSIWGLLIFRDDAAITAPSWANCIAVIEADGANPVTYVDSPLEAGTWHYRTAVFNVDGILGAVKADGSCVVT